LVASRQKQKRKDFTRLLLYLRRSVKRPGIRIHLNITATPQFINQMRPDIIMFAVGAEPVKPNLPVADGRNVMQAIDVILGRINVGKRVIVVGGRSLGIEIADQLATYGRKVGIVTIRELGRNMGRSIFLALRNRLISKGVCLFPHSPVVEITEQGLYAVYGNELVFMQADTVVLATGMQPKSAFSDSLQKIDCEVYKIGDCVEVRGIELAIREAAEVARRI
jgi:pyruvate/2-oxoglutarate dehydrogenase complex dihydrolipoamide dehydrogenase (E3) component